MSLIKLTLTVDKTALAAAKRYSKRRGTSLSRMVDQFLSSLPHNEVQNTPTVQRLIGVLPKRASTAEYGRYLDEKYRR
ncbi:MAG TPA: DUF6364 family protein [Burkholderiales bacterium]|nr:DUF6364 family protein [Burkholderiales bacterium]